MACAGREVLTVTRRLLSRPWSTAAAVVAAWPCSLCPGRLRRAFPPGNCPLRPGLKPVVAPGAPSPPGGEVSALSLAAFAVCAARGPYGGVRLSCWAVAPLCLAAPCARVVAFSRPPRCPDLPAVSEALREEARGDCWVGFVNTAPEPPAVLHSCKLGGRGVLSTMSPLPPCKRS